MGKTVKLNKSKWFRVAVEGATTDGRKIKRSWIEQMAKNYNPDVYGARVNIEHIKGYHPDSSFKRYGDILAVKAEEIKDGLLAGKLALYVQIEPTEDLIKLNKSKQKVYTSIEVNVSFADTGEAYLIGLAVTDDPASLGTEFLEFSANATVNPLTNRKQDPDNLFTVAEETIIEFESNEQQDDVFSSMIERLAGIFKNKSEKDTEKFTQLGGIVEEFFNHSIEKFESLESQITNLNSELNDVKQKNAEYAELLSQLPDTPERPLSTGGSDKVETDC